MVSLSGVPSCLCRPTFSASRPRVVFGPIVNTVRAFFAVQEANLNQSRYQRPILAEPVSRQLNVLVCQAD